MARLINLERLKERIKTEGRVLGSEILKVDSFLNHQMDPLLFEEMAEEFYREYKDCGVNKILTIEASGIGVACMTGLKFKATVLFAKKSRSRVSDSENYSAEVESFTHGCVNTVFVSKRYLGPKDKVLVIDDFLANGEALKGLFEICRLAGAELVGAGIVIEKAFQPGGDNLRAKGYKIYSLARVASMSESEGVKFA